MPRINSTALVLAMATAIALGLSTAQPRAAEIVLASPSAPSSQDVVDNTIGSKDHTTLAAAVQAAGLADTLKGPGPFTVFAPTDEAFAALPNGTVDNLLKTENQAALRRLLTHHVVAGRLDRATLMKQVAAGGGQAQLKTVQGGLLVATISGPSVMLTDGLGGMARVTDADHKQSNGIVHVVDKVLMPK